MAAFEVRAALIAGWRVFKARPLFWIGVEAAIMALSVGSAIAIALVLWGILLLAGAGDPPLVIVLIFGLTGVSLWSVVVSQLALGKIHICLQGIDGAVPTLAGLFAKRHLLWPFLVGYSLFGIAVGLGFLLLVVPGVYLLLRWSFWACAMIDHDLSVRDAFAASARLTEGHRLKLLLFWIVIGGGLAATTMLVHVLVGTLFPSAPEAVTEGIGLMAGWIYSPLIWLSFTGIYRRLAGGRASGAVESTAMNTSRAIAGG
jgi:hypothetical protein